MNRKPAYATLADWFEYLNDDCGYENWSQYLILELKKSLEDYRLPPVGLDVGCGSGYFTRAFQKNGFSMTGMDVSVEMLDRAKTLALQEGARSEYLLGDITKFKTPSRYSFVTAINDCINYVKKDKLRTAFKNVRSALSKNGIFLFDISSKGKFSQKIANTVSADDRDDVTYLSFNTLSGDEVTMDVTLFIKGADGRFDRFDERHVQYVYEESEIVTALEETGFEILRMEGHLGEDKEKSDRISFLARRI
ncbi:MAG: class I SAM-dependent methyltransferase [Clostridia bacterium]|nr:class I SAM-dependent methyltransferase [Clostridia bacterium]